MNSQSVHTLDCVHELAIVIPVHNRREFTRACLERLHSQSRQDFEIIVVDDGSTDGTGEMIRRDFPQVVILRGDGDLWWTGATNLGVKLALEQGIRRVMTLNDDTLPDRFFVERMLQAAEQKPGALIGAFAIDANTGRPVFGGARMNWFTTYAKELLDDPQTSPSGLVEVTHFPGRGLLVPAEVFRRAGLFDSVHFPHYMADYDFTHRARRKGFPVYCNFSAPLGIYPDASGDAENRRQKNWGNYYRHLFHIKGAANLKAFFWMAVRNCPPALLPVCLPVGLACRILGYPTDWFVETCNSLWRRNGLYRRA